MAQVQTKTVLSIGLETTSRLRKLIEIKSNQFCQLNRLEAAAVRNNSAAGCLTTGHFTLTLDNGLEPVYAQSNDKLLNIKLPNKTTNRGNKGWVGKYQLIYFPVRGRGEPVRYLLVDNGIDYEEILCTRENWQTEWKPQMQFGQVPALRDGPLQVVQSNAILRHLARKHDLYGSGLEEAAYIDMINDGVEDLRVKYLKLIYRNYEDGKDEYIAELPSQLQPFENLLAKNGADKTGFCVGNKRSFPDYNLMDILDIHQVLAPKCLDDFPVLSAYCKLNLSRPAIAAYRKTDEFKKRTINGNGKQ